MTTEKAEHEQPSSSQAPGIRGKWINPRRKRFWAIVLVLLYTLSGFFLVPVLLEKSLVNTLRDKLGREANIEQIQFNPFVLSLKLNGFELRDTDQEKLAGFDEFFVNFQLSSLFRWAWTFREVRLDGFHGLLERFSVDESRLSRLLDDAAANGEQESEPSEEGGLPRLLIHNLSLNQGSAELRDHVPESPVVLQMGPIDINIHELNTLPDRYGQQHVVIRLPGNASLGWQGSISLAPLESSGTLTIENSRLDQTIAYLKAVLPLESMAATLSMSTDYRIQTMSDGTLDIELDGLEAELSSLVVTGLTPSTEFLNLPSLAIAGGKLRYPENEFQLSSVRVVEPGLTVWKDPEGKLNLLDLVPETTNSADSEQNSDSLPWKIGIDEFLIDGGNLDIADRSINPAAEAEVMDIRLQVTNVSNAADQVLPVSLSGKIDGGEFGFDGELLVLPEFRLKGNSRLSQIPLTLAQPYIKQSLSLLIEDGKLDSQAELQLEATEKIMVSGAVSVAGLNVSDTIENEQLVAWEKLSVDRFELDVAAQNLKLSSVQFEQLYGRVEINQDRTTNLDGLVIKDTTDEAAEPAQAEASDPWSIVIGAISINESTMDFTDLSLPLHFGTRVSDMEGTISTIDTSSVEPANIRLEGQVDEFGLARIDGSMNMLDPIRHTDVSLEFRNLLMSNLSPYSAQFAGQEIDEGKLDLDLRYFIDQGQLKGQNDIVLSDLQLGKKVDHPDAASLPLGLAVALLKDSNGVIDIDLPVEGDINDPEFRIGGVIWQAFAGLITKVISAPFRLLGNLIGIDSEDLGQFQFLAGRTDLTPPELEKISQLQKALQQRPELSIEISGGYDAAIDVPKMQFFRMRDIVINRLGQEPAEQDEKFEMLNVEIRSTLESLYIERFPDSTPDTLKAAHTAPPVDKPEDKPVLDDLAYATDLWNRLLASEEITPADLESLANTRANVIQAAFLESGEFDQSRVTVSAPSEVKSEDGEWVVIELGVASN